MDEKIMCKDCKMFEYQDDKFGDCTNKNIRSKHGMINMNKN